MTTPTTTPNTKPASAPTSSDDLRKTVNRLKRAQGQLAAVITAVESGADCRAVVTQLAAVSSAIDRAGFTIISSAMKQCLVDVDGSDVVADPGTIAAVGGKQKLSVDELEKLFLALA